MSKAMNIDNCFECKHHVPGDNFNSTDVKEPKPSFCNKLKKGMYGFFAIYSEVFRDCPLEDAPND